MTEFTTRPIKLDEINPLTLLAKAFEEKNAKECVELVTGIFAYLTHRQPPASLRRKWKKEAKARTEDREITSGDFEIKTLKRRGRPTGMYYISVRSDTKRLMKQRKGRAISCEAYLNYDNTNLCWGIGGRRDTIARRAHQLSKLGNGGFYQQVRKRKTKAR